MAAKTWGPFTGAQLTMMFLAVAVLALPDRLLAVATSAVSITDAANGHTAAVSSGRLLFVTDTALEQPVTPSAFFHSPYMGVATPNECRVIYTPPSGKAAVVTDVRVNVYQDPSPGAANKLSIYSGTGCNTFIAGVNPPTVGHYVVPFGPGFGTQRALSVRPIGGVKAEVFADGYLVPASQVPAASATPAVATSAQAQQQQGSEDQ